MIIYDYVHVCIYIHKHTYTHCMQMQIVSELSLNPCQEFHAPAGPALPDFTIAKDGAVEPARWLR